MAQLAVGHPAPHRYRVGAAAQLFPLCGAPAAWSLLELVQYALVSHACFPTHQPRATLPPGWSSLQPVLVAVGALAVAIGVAALLVAWRNLRATSREHPGAVGDLLEVGEGRTRFLAVWGMLLSGGFVAATLFQILALILVPPCAP